MAKILSKNKEYDGVSASVSFKDGVGETDNKYLIEWFAEHGYTVEEDEVKGKKPTAKKEGD